jgi:hypothetical protein
MLRDRQAGGKTSDTPRPTTAVIGDELATAVFDANADATRSDP